MSERDVAESTQGWDRRLTSERERARRLAAATSALSTAALGLVVSLALPWVQSSDEHEGFDPVRALQLDESGPWRADGWFLLRNALTTAGQDGAATSVVLTVLPLLAAAVALWAALRQGRTAALAARIAGALAVIGLLAVGLRFLDGPGLDLGAGFWLAVVLGVVVAGGGLLLERALQAPGGLVGGA